jgi:hypothetical protein
MLEYSIGGQEVKLDNANEGIADIPQNKTLLVQKLTGNAPLRPEMVYNLQTVEDVFGHFKPKIDVQFENVDGSIKNETLSFHSLGDFGRNGLVNQSMVLQDLHLQINDFHQMIKQFKSNKILKAALTDQTAKAAYLSAIQSMIDELETAKK